MWAAAIKGLQTYFRLVRRCFEKQEIIFSTMQDEAKNKEHRAIDSPKIQFANLVAGQDHRRAKFSVGALKIGYILQRLQYQVAATSVLIRAAPQQ
jgi:hypothetical protein